MRLALLATLLISMSVQQWMLRAFYPVLLLLLVAASLGIPIPEDVPLIAAGVILAREPETATWGGTLLIALLGIMCGDVILYVLGKRWGPEVFSHRWVRRAITPKRFRRMTRLFNRYGMWMCFFARFFMGIRAAMCVTAGVTRLSFWRFLIADFAGALLSVPLFVWLGYWFANMIPTLKAYVHIVQLALVLLGLVACVVFFYRMKRARSEPAEMAEIALEEAGLTLAAPKPDTPPAPSANPAQAAASLEPTAAASADRKSPPPRKPETCA